MRSLLAVGHPLASPQRQVAALDATAIPGFDETLSRHGIAPLTTGKIEVLQVNVGKLCNQTCAHCHVDAGPDRRESMTRQTAEMAIELLRRPPSCSRCRRIGSHIVVIWDVWTALLVRCAVSSDRRVTRGVRGSGEMAGGITRRRFSEPSSARGVGDAACSAESSSASM